MLYRCIADHHFFLTQAGGLEDAWPCPWNAARSPLQRTAAGDTFRPPAQGTHFEWQQRSITASVQAAITAADGPVQRWVPPEGTRGETRHWKTGFQTIALKAKVPIMLAFMDYERRISGPGPVFTPTGDVERDMAEIKRFYAPFKGKRAGHFEAD